MDEINDIFDCIAKFDKTASIEIKGRYFETIQRDVERLKDAWEKEQLFCGTCGGLLIKQNDRQYCKKCRKYL